MRSQSVRGLSSRYLEQLAPSFLGSWTVHAQHVVLVVQRRKGSFQSTSTWRAAECVSGGPPCKKKKALSLEGEKG